MTEADLQFVDRLVVRLGRQRRALIPILQAIQEHYRYLPPEALERLSRVSRITPAMIAAVATFYGQFRHQPMGRHLVRICHGTACHVKGAPLVHDAFVRHLKIPAGEDTDPEGTFTIQKVACLGCCTLAPVVQIGQVTYGHLTSEVVAEVVEDFLEQERRRAAGGPLRPAPAPGEARGEVRIGLGSCCVARGSARVREALEDALAGTGVRVTVKRVGCVGMCHQTPLVEVVPASGAATLYAQVAPGDARGIVRRHFRPRGPLRRIAASAGGVLEKLLTDETSQPERRRIEVRDAPVAAFLGPQRHVATEHCGMLDPTDLEEYVSFDGFAALRACLTGRSPEQVIDEIRRSGLRGRGGAGYPSGAKWSSVRQAEGNTKYIVCNADEGDPGAFMDRMILESYPYRVIEGMIVAAYAVGAHEGYFYIRAEYPLAVERVREALRRLGRRGILGQDILGSGFALQLDVMEGAGAFVCGEETALLASIEGRRGMPRLRPPYPAVSGLWGKPTLVNNVETYALVPWIIRHGAEAFAAIGTAGSKGTKVFALAGKVRRGGLIEVPMGVTIRQIVEDVGGGVGAFPAPEQSAREPEERGFKAVQVGGPSGGCVPAALADTPVDYEALTGLGAIMGSGGLVVLDDADCMVDIARYFLEFTQDPSCGKCTPCRVGTRRMLDILERLCAGEARAGDLDELEALARTVKATSLCGLGKTAPNPVLSTLKYFRDEYEAHLAGRCPAGRCKALIRYVITDDCIGCTLCSQHCPADAIAMRPFQKHEIDVDKCVRCGTCRQICPASAVKVESPCRP